MTDIVKSLKRMSQEHAKPLMCAKCKDGSWVIYIAPGSEDTMGLMLNAALEIEKDKK